MRPLVPSTGLSRRCEKNREALATVHQSSVPSLPCTAAIPAALAGWGIYLWSGAEQGWMLANLLFGAAGTALICSVAGAIYLGILAALRTPELTSAISLVRARFGRR